MHCSMDAIVSRARSAALLCMLATLFAGCATTPPEPPRRQPSGMPSSVWADPSGQPLPYETYIARARQAIARYRWFRPDETPQAREGIVDHIAPAQWSPRAGCTPGQTTGVLLVHGLSDSPYLMRELAGRLYHEGQDCRLIRTLLLPGHATRPGDLLGVSYKDWITAVQYGVLSFDGAATGVHLIGFSTGAALSLVAAASPAATHIRSLTLISPAIRASGTIARLGLTPRAFGWLSATTGFYQWLDRHDDIDFAKYESFPTNAAAQLIALDDQLNAILTTQLPMPMLMLVSLDDATIDPDEAIRVFKEQTHPNSRLQVVAADTQHPSLIELRQNPRVLIRAAAHPGLGVIRYAHVSFVNSPQNTHYGQNGDYANCLWYDQPDDTTATQKFCRCVTPSMRQRLPQCAAIPATDALHPSDIRYGERNAQDIARFLLRRLTFNPAFDEDVRQIDQFIQTAPQP